MARHKKIETENDTPGELDISSLIDVCFLLLIYFIVTSTISRRETDLNMQLPSPSAPSSDQAKIDPLFIKVNDKGVILTGTGTGEQQLDSDTSSREVPLLDSQLQLYSSAARSAGNNPLVQIYVDPSSSQQRVIDVLNALAAAEITSVTFTDLLE
jgi:biopolymer transport protein ExbD